MKEFRINQQTLTSVANYLATKPWREVNGLIRLLDQLEEIKDVKKSK